MTYAVRVRQARAAALGFWCPIDGEDGPRTRKAVAAATAAQQARGLPFIHPSGLTRIHLHWSAGGYSPSRLDRQHYHVGIDGDGDVLEFHDPTTKLAHTLRANTGSIGVAVLAMGGAVERPFSSGRYPLRAVQQAALARVARSLGATFDIPVSRFSMLTHAEVQPTLGIRQRGKWDICWLPGMGSAGDPIAVGDKLRAQILRVVL